MGKSREESLIYSQAIQMYAEGRLEVQGHRVLAKGMPKAPDSFMINPPAKILE
jgi:hypothetical protein